MGAKVGKNGKRFKSQIQVGKKMLHLGMYATVEEAAIAYDRAAIVHKRPKTDLNFPDEDHGPRPESEKEKRKKAEATM